MWEVMCKDVGIEVGSGKKVVFVGDAAGRKDDHSDADFHFCENLNTDLKASGMEVEFFTPEELFLGEETTERGHRFLPEWFLPAEFGGSAIQREKVSSAASYKFVGGDEVVEILLLVGLPGAGKTTYLEREMSELGFERVSEKEMGAFEDARNIVMKYVQEGKSV